MKRQQARLCMCARTKQTIRFCTSDRGKTPVVCSLEPCAGRAHTSSVPTEQRHREKEQNNSYRCGALGPTAAEDYLISEQQDAHIEKSRSCLLGPGFLPDIAIACSKTLDCPTAVEKDNETKGENLPALPANCKNLRHRREKAKHPAVPVHHTNRRTCLVSV